MKEKFKYMKTDDGKILFRILNSSSSYTFSNPKNMGKTTKSFLDYVMSCQLEGIKPTKRKYLESMGRSQSRGGDINGYLSTFFRSIVESGIVSKHTEWNGNFKETWYSIGENFHHYLNGNIEKYYHGKHGNWSESNPYGWNDWYLNYQVNRNKNMVIKKNSTEWIVNQNKHLIK